MTRIMTWNCIVGDHFALCIEYVLRQAPHVEAQQLITSQQVLQRVTEPVRKSRALSALELKLLKQKNSSCSKTPMLVDDKPHIPLSPCVGPLQDEQQQVSSECRPTTLDESIQIFEAMDLGVVGESPQEKVGKRKRKLLKKLERVRLRKGKTTTIGEFDFLFETASRDDSKVKEFHHWEVSVKYLLYAGPWEVFGVRTPKYAAWSNPDTQDSDSKPDPRSQECLDTESRGGAVRMSHGHESDSNIGDEGSTGTRTTTAGVYSGLNSSRAEEQNGHVNAAEDDEYLYVESLGDDAGWTTQEYPREVDNFLGCYLGPHVGETLLDRKARLRNQLALSTNPHAALLLRDLYVNKGTDEIAEKEMTEGLANIPSIASTQLLEPSTVITDGVSTNVTHDRQGVTEEDRDGGSNNEGTEDLVVVPSALLKGYLFYEYKLWRFLERCSNRNVAEASFEQDKGRSVSEYPINGTIQSHDVSRENKDETICQSAKFEGVEIQDSQLTEKASLNTNHWMGWWTRDIMEFADLPVHQQSKWYIVPKLEWLSPVVIPESDTDRCARVLSLADFVVTAAQVADEAARLLMPRKRRFLGAEVRWTGDWEPCQESVSSPTCASVLEKEQATMSAWLEVSRGFVVEGTWPVSKMYRPHGYVVSWSPNLQGRHVDEPEM